MQRNSIFRRFHEILSKIKIKKMLKNFNIKTISEEEINDPKYIGKLAHNHSNYPDKTDEIIIKKKKSLQEQKSDLDMKEY